jgi:hypothetical protein
MAKDPLVTKDPPEQQHPQSQEERIEAQDVLLTGSVKENVLGNEETFETAENMSVKRVPEVSIDGVIFEWMIVVEEKDDGRWVAIFKYEKIKILYFI